MEFFRSNILTITLFTPLVGALLIMFLPKEGKDTIRWVGNVFAFLGFLISLALIFWFDADQGGFQFVKQVEWIPTIGAQYHLGLDGISLLMVLLTTLLGFLSILSSWTAIGERVKEYYAFFLILQTGMLGVFMSLDFFLFYVFWEVMLVPMYFLIGIWGTPGPRRLYAAIKFFLFTLVGSVLLLLGILALYFNYYEQFGARTFDITRLMELNLPLETQVWIFLAFFVGFAIKVPMFPFHTWLPDAHTEAPTAGSVILAGVLLKMGTYGFVRFSLPLLPQASAHSQVVRAMVLLSIIAIIYGALVSLMQKDWKKLVAYSSVSHLGFCTLGLFALNPNGIAGSILQQINHGITTGALFLIVGIVYERRHTREISEYSGLSSVMPVFATIFMIITMASIGVPGLNGFIGEFTILQGAFEESWIWAAFAVLGIVLGAAYMLWLYQRTMFGPITNAKNEKLPDLNLRELVTLVPLVILAFWIGLYPKPYFRILEKPVAQIVERVRPGYYAQRGIPSPLEAVPALPSGGTAVAETSGANVPPGLPANVRPNMPANERPNVPE